MCCGRDSDAKSIVMHEITTSLGGFSQGYVVQADTPQLRVIGVARTAFRAACLGLCISLKA